ncbi:MAG: ABC transporter ATP-binding protein [Alphaproteobacteria bacterium]|nr:ABC transporter ATP-binding protein [Alphaproteobacteria bacterium]
MIEIANLSRSYTTGDVTTAVLRGIDLRIDPGEVSVILGPSGSGKTTLMNIIGGVDRADGGRAVVDGLDLSGLSDDGLTDYRRARVGFVFQFYNLVPNLTVGENVELVAEISPSPLDIDEVLGAVGVLDKKDRFPRALSGGEQQRVALARAIVKNPKILLCDEPTGALDYETARSILALIQRLNQGYGTTTVMVTHNTAIAAMATSVFKLRDGVIEEASTGRAPAPAEGIRW